MAVWVGVDAEVREARNNPPLTIILTPTLTLTHTLTLSP